MSATVQVIVHRYLVPDELLCYIVISNDSTNILCPKACQALQIVLAAGYVRCFCAQASEMTLSTPFVQVQHVKCAFCIFAIHLTT